MSINMVIFTHIPRSDIMTWEDILKRKINDPFRGGPKRKKPDLSQYYSKPTTKTKEQREKELARVREENRRDKEAQMPSMVKDIEKAILSSHSSKIMKVVDKITKWFSNSLQGFDVSEQEVYEDAMKDWQDGVWEALGDNTIEQAKKEAKGEAMQYSRRKKEVGDILNRLQALDVKEVVAAMVRRLINGQYKRAKGFQNALKEDRQLFNDSIDREFYEFFSFFFLVPVFSELDIPLENYYELIRYDLGGGR